MENRGDTQKNELKPEQLELKANIKTIGHGRPALKKREGNALLWKNIPVT